MPDPYVGISPHFPMVRSLPVINEVMGHSSSFAPNFYAKLVLLAVMHVVC